MSYKETTERKTEVKNIMQGEIVFVVYSTYIFENNYYTNVSQWSQGPSDQM